MNKIITTLVVILCLAINGKAQNKLYGLTTSGGANGLGVIYSTDVDGTNLQVLHNFLTADGSEPFSSMVLATNGKLYGTTYYGGLNGDGVIFEFDPSDNTYTKKKDFNSAVNGDSPIGKLVEVNNLLYGTASFGGTNNKGVIFTYDYTNNVRTVIHEFAGTDGQQVETGMTYANGLLYGLTSIGGANGYGVIYTIDPSDNSFMKINDLTSSFGSYSNSQFELGDSGLLYAITGLGGTSNGGTIFSLDPTDNSTTLIKNLDYTTGYSSLGGFTKAFNGKLYAVGRKGGSSGDGALFVLDTETNTVTKLINFGGDKGNQPSSKLHLSSNGNLYGTTKSGGANGMGTLFEYNPYDNVFTKLLDFDDTNGASPLVNSLTEVFETNLPVITAEPEVSLTPCKGETLELMIFASGPNLTYQWTKDGEGITGATSSIYIIENIDYTYNATYKCRVSNSYGTITSSAINVITINPPSVNFDPLDAVTYGDAPFEVSAIKEAGSAVVFSSSNTDVATLSGSIVTIVGAGTTNIIASSSNDCFTTDVPQELIVNKADHTLTFDALTNSTYGNGDITLTAASSASVPVTFSSSDENVVTVSGSTLTIVGVGTATITASSEDNNYNLATATQDITINKADQVINFDVLAGKIYGDATFDLTATTNSGLDMTYFSSDETVANINGTTVTIVGAGTATITASQAGNEYYNAAVDVSQMLTVNKADQTITFEAIPTLGMGEVYIVNATSTSGLPIVLTSSNETLVSITDGQLDVHGFGEVTITASQAGDSNYNAATSVSQTITINTITGNEEMIDYKVYPNPTSDAIVVIGLEKNTEFDVFNVNGVKQMYTISESSLHRIKLDISHLVTGIYILQLRRKDGLENIRIIKN